MHLSEQELIQVKELARHFFSPREIAIFLQKDIGEFTLACDDEHSPIFFQYQGGVLQTKYEVNKQVLQLANSGSSPAQTMALQLMKDGLMNKSNR
jgi:hypothetical protein